MSKPRVTLSIAPSVGNISIGSPSTSKVRYLALAPSAPNEGERFQLSFQARFTNDGSNRIRVTKLRITLPDAPQLGDKEILIKTEHTTGDKTIIGNGLPLTAGETGTPRDFRATDNWILRTTPPESIKFETFADGFTEPDSVVLKLARHQSPVSGGAYAWMGKAHDLRRGEFWSGLGADHCCGPQLFAHDLNIVYFDEAKGDWTRLLPNGDKAKNEDYRIWGKPVYAMADGTVRNFANHFPNSTETPELPENPPSTPGNHFLLLHGDELMLYAHFQPGSLNESLMQEGASVKAGDFLGLVGNSGNSSAPHLHIHALNNHADESRQRLRPIPWRKKMVAQRKKEIHVRANDWILSEEQGLPVVKTLIYPGDAMPADQREWSKWTSLGGEVIFGPCVSSWMPNRLDVFGIGTDRALYHKFWNGNRWSGWEHLRGQLNSKPAAVSWAINRIDVFARRVADNALNHKWWDGSRWHDWEGLGGTLLSGPAVCSRRPNHLDVFVVATDRSLYHRIWTGSSWTPWESLGGKLRGDPAAVAWDDDRIDVFARGDDDKLWHKWWDGSRWHEWEPRGRDMIHSPAVSSRSANHLDVFIVARDGTLQHNIWDRSRWTPWESLGGLLTSDPAAVSWDRSRIDVFGRATDNAVYQTFWEPAPFIMP